MQWLLFIIIELEVNFEYMSANDISKHSFELRRTSERQELWASNADKKMFLQQIVLDGWILLSYATNWIKYVKILIICIVFLQVP